MRAPLEHLCLALACAVSSAAPAQNFPVKPVKILSSGGAGGPNDTQTRGLAQFLTERMGQSFVIENRTGAGGIVAGEVCSKAPPDGYTLCTFGSGAIGWTPVLTHMSYDPIKDLTGVFHMGFIDSIISAHPSVRADTLGELVALAREKPGVITWASFGLTTSSYFYVQWLKKFRNVEFLIVPYKTAIQAQQAVVSGEAMVNIYTAGQTIPMVKAGKVKALAVNSDARLAELPNLQTDKEAGFGLPVIRSWFGMLAPAGTPGEITVRLNTEMNRITEDPKYAELYVKRLGFRTANMNVDQFNEYLRRNRAEFEEFARQMGLQRQ
jgi:tripartite-type tricarboxylate transporter receptor subunit TctC